MDNLQKQPRFVVKFVNGIWTIFDTVRFCNCEADLRTRKAAEQLLKKPCKK